MEAISHLRGASICVALLSLVMMTGCPAPEDVSERVLIRTTPETAGPRCATGGVRIEVGTDTDGDGVLEDEEVSGSATQYVCNGEDGDAALIQEETLPYGSEECRYGGVRISTGIDVDGSGTLEASEVQSTRDVCSSFSCPHIDLTVLDEEACLVSPTPSTTGVELPPAGSAHMTSLASGEVFVADNRRIWRIPASGGSPSLFFDVNSLPVGVIDNLLMGIAGYGDRIYIRSMVPAPFFMDEVHRLGYLTPDGVYHSVLEGPELRPSGDLLFVLDPDHIYCTGIDGIRQFTSTGIELVIPTTGGAITALAVDSNRSRLYFSAERNDGMAIYFVRLDESGVPVLPVAFRALVPNLSDTAMSLSGVLGSLQVHERTGDVYVFYARDESIEPFLEASVFRITQGEVRPLLDATTEARAFVLPGGGDTLHVLNSAGDIHRYFVSP